MRKIIAHPILLMLFLYTRAFYELSILQYQIENLSKQTYGAAHV